MTLDEEGEGQRNFDKKGCKAGTKSLTQVPRYRREVKKSI